MAGVNFDRITVPIAMLCGAIPLFGGIVWAAANLSSVAYGTVARVDKLEELVQEIHERVIIICLNDVNCRRELNKNKGVK